MWQSVKFSNVSNTLTLERIFWKTETFFTKLASRLLVETTNIENTSFPFKTTLSETNVKTNRMATTKWTYHKEWSFSSNYFIFLEFFFQFWNFLKRFNLMYQQPKCPYSCFSLALEFIFRVLFSCEYQRISTAVLAPLPLLTYWKFLLILIFSKMFWLIELNYLDHCLFLTLIFPYPWSLSLTMILANSYTMKRT